MANDNFCGDESYEKWISRQYDSIELKIIQEIHNIYPSWTLDDIKMYAPDFMSAHMKIIKRINDDESTLSIKDIEERAFSYVSAGIHGNKVHIEVFGKEVPKDDYRYLSKWNTQLGKIMRILINGTKYKYEDERGHSSMHSFKFNKYVYGFRSEMELDRDIKEIVELNRERFGTKSDFFRELIFKGIAVFSIINKGLLGEKAEYVLKDIEKYERKDKEFKIRDILADMEDTFKERYDTLKDIEDDNDALEEFRDDITGYISDELNRHCSKQDKARIRSVIKSSRELSRILDILEGERLVSKNYVKSVLDKGIVIPFIDVIEDDDNL